MQSRHVQAVAAVGAEGLHKGGMASEAVHCIPDTSEVQAEACTPHRGYPSASHLAAQPELGWLQVRLRWGQQEQLGWGQREQQQQVLTLSLHSELGAASLRAQDKMAVQSMGGSEM